MHPDKLIMAPSGVALGPFTFEVDVELGAPGVPLPAQCDTPGSCKFSFNSYSHLTALTASDNQRAVIISTIAALFQTKGYKHQEVVPVRKPETTWGSFV